jgi:hypothetical protein
MAQQHAIRQRDRQVQTDAGADSRLVGCVAVTLLWGACLGGLSTQHESTNTAMLSVRHVGYAAA